MHPLSAPLALAGVSLVAALPTTPSQTTKRSSSSAYGSLIVFGDSLSDNGNGAYRISNHTWPANPAYYHGHFSDGPVWGQYLAGNLSVPLFDYAIGGATTDNARVQGATGPGSSILVPSVYDEVTNFLDGISPANVSLTDAEKQLVYNEVPGGAPPLFAILAGVNDFFFNYNASAAQTFLTIDGIVTKLRAKIPQAGIVTVVPMDIATLPIAYFTDPLVNSQAQTFSDQLGDLLVNENVAVSALTRQRVAAGGEPAGRKVTVDLRPLFNSFGYYAEPESYGYDKFGKYGSCLVGVYMEAENVTLCDDPGRRVYFDEYHPTTRTHQWIAQEILNAL